MKAYSIHPQTQELREIDIQIQANTAYTFFSSILIDESEIINNHIVYTDANALSEKKRPFLLGGQLLLGDALVLGRDDFTDLEVSIYEDELSSLISYDIGAFYTEALTLLCVTQLNLYRTMEVMQKEEIISLNIEWVLSTFNIADERTKEYFLNELKNTINAQESVEQYMNKMAALALNAAS